MPEIPAEWYIDRLTVLTRELAEATKGMAIQSAALREARQELAQAQAALRDAAAPTTTEA